MYQGSSSCYVVIAIYQSTSDLNSEEIENKHLLLAIVKDEYIVVMAYR